MELEVHHEICITTMEVISHMLFSNNDKKTQQVFIEQKTLFEMDTSKFNQMKNVNPYF
jgi:hypothetical protein